MRPEGPRQRQAAALAGSSTFLHLLIHDQFLSPTTLSYTGASLPPTPTTRPTKKVLGYKGKWGPLSSHASWAMGPNLWLTPSTSQGGPGPSSSVSYPRTSSPPLSSSTLALPDDILHPTHVSSRNSTIALMASSFHSPLKTGALGCSHLQSTPILCHRVLIWGDQALHSVKIW